MKTATREDGKTERDRENGNSNYMYILAIAVHVNSINTHDSLYINLRLNINKM